MIVLIKVFVESIRQAFSQLTGNKLRSFLSLLGITIGIFCIIGVKSAVDSLEDNVRGSFDKLGSDVVYVSKFSWSEPPHNSWWKWIRRPNPSIEDYRILTRKVKNAEQLSYYVVLGLRTLKYKSNSVDRAALVGTTYDFVPMFNLNVEKGRYYTRSEHQSGTNKIVLGAKLAEELFGNIEPVGRFIKISGKKMEVIGVLEKNGEDLISVMNFDEAVIMSYNYAKNFANLKAKNIFDAAVTVKATDGVGLRDLKDEMTGVLRAHRRLKPKQENDFALNELTMLTQLLDGFFSVLNTAGFIIGIFAILVGMFSVANIMFVSVKERTNIIGVKKALGAKRWVILLEFLVEAIILCVIGGAFGLLFISGIAAALTAVLDFDIYLSVSNMMLGLFVSIGVGILAGVIPAFSAARMDPVEAMRQ
ncbi:MAG: ABC transporter permease [Bacteroidota bacterium]